MKQILTIKFIKMKKRSLKKWFSKVKKDFVYWLLYDFVQEFYDDEMSYMVCFYIDGVKVVVSKMTLVPQIGSEVEVLVRTQKPDQEKIFLVERVRYSSYGVAVKVYGKYV